MKLIDDVLKMMSRYTKNIFVNDGKYSQDMNDCLGNLGAVIDAPFDTSEDILKYLEDTVKEEITKNMAVIDPYNARVEEQKFNMLIDDKRKVNKAYRHLGGMRAIIKFIGKEIDRVKTNNICLLYELTQISSEVKKYQSEIARVDMSMFPSYYTTLSSSVYYKRNLKKYNEPILEVHF